ncbi:MAG: hypothetical protein CMC07_10340 [Flavobacteriaceae bacterium]|jgi:amino acid transporter|nr:hypothetical protein [Flavobacteriaceae bacterium]HBY69066.1 hypothetical protein [Flavobacteriaceae bacterium]|tara:strand:- start:47494 stop:47721 length:228 start_codon:yes stop_codon:yes gene_type:complete
MFKQVINHKGFWKSVFLLGISFVVLFVFIKWAFDGFSTSFFDERNPYIFIGGSLLAGLIYGFFVTYGKFKKKLKK